MCCEQENENVLSTYTEEHIKNLMNLIRRCSKKSNVYGVETEDVIQESMVRILKGAPLKYINQIVFFSASRLFFYSKLRGLRTKKFNKASIDNEDTTDDIVVDVRKSKHYDSKFNLIRDEMESLVLERFGEVYKTIFVMKTEGYTNVEIAKSFGITKQAIDYKWQRIKSFLQELYVD